MHILPDIHFVKNFKRHYSENYDKLQTKMAESAERRQAHGASDLKYGFTGFAAAVLVIGCFAIPAVIVSRNVVRKNQTITSLEQQITDVSLQIASYEAVNGDEMKEQVNNAVAWVTYLQNQYLTQEFEKDFDVYAARYLGDYNSDWSEGQEFDDPVWKGYVNMAAGFDSEANLVFMLYDGDSPVLLADAVFSLDQSGNLGSMTSVEKLWLI